jgi:hypothetical protein
MKGMTRIELTDNSTARTATGKKFKLSEAYFLCRGTSWYQAIHTALEPEESMRNIVLEWRSRLESLTWDRVWPCIHALKPDYPEPPIDPQTPIMTAFQSLRSTDFFADLGPYLYGCCQIGSTHGMTWSGPI